MFEGGGSSHTGRAFPGGEGEGAGGGEGGHSLRGERRGREKQAHRSLCMSEYVVFIHCTYAYIIRTYSTHIHMYITYTIHIHITYIDTYILMNNKRLFPLIFSPAYRGYI